MMKIKKDFVLWMNQTVARDVRFLTEEPSLVTIIDDIDGEDTADEPIDNDSNELATSSDSQIGPAKIRKRRTTVLQDIDENNILDTRLRNRGDSSMDIMAMAMLSIDEEPTSYEDALNSNNAENWLQVMNDEYHSLIQNETWTLVDEPNNQKVIDNKWVFKVKKNPDDSIERFKARLVVRGSTQKYGVDYMETFSPVVRFTSVRAILAIATKMKMEIIQFDVKTAFLNGELEEVVYMKQPIGFSDDTNKVCLLKKSLYGLKQASRCWNIKFKSFIEEFDFKVCDSDPCVFVRSKNSKTTILAIYVDDGIIVGDDTTEMQLVIEHLRKQFEIKLLNVGCFLGFQINQLNDGSIFINQSAYAKKVLHKFQMEECHAVAIPSDSNQVLCNFGDSEPSKYPYRQLVGSMMYLAVCTRPDISFAIGNVSRYMEAPSVVHENALKRILKYIKGTIYHGILYNSNGEYGLCGYSDSDYAGDVETRRSTSGNAFLFNNGIISWSSERQKCVSVSTTEAEYVAASNGIKELVWLRRLFDELLPNKIENVTFFMDIQSAIRLVKNPEFHKPSKHIDVRYHFIREKYEEGFFQLEYISTNEMIVDIFTKALPKQRFQFLRDMMGITINDN